MSTMTVAEADAQLTAPGQMFEMDEVEIRGVPTKVWKNCPATLADILTLSRGHADKTFIVYEDRRITFEEHFRSCAHFAHLLRDRFGVREGDRVAIAMRNLPEWSVAFWGASAAGAVVGSLTAWWTGEELQYGLAASGPKIRAGDAARGARVPEHLGELPDLEQTIVVGSKGNR